MVVTLLWLSLFILERDRSDLTLKDIDRQLTISYLKFLVMHCGSIRRGIEQKEIGMINMSKRKNYDLNKALAFLEGPTQNAF